MPTSLLAAWTLVLAANAFGWPAAPNAAGFCIGLTGVLFVAGLGFLHALGTLHRDAADVKAPLA